MYSVEKIFKTRIRRCGIVAAASALAAILIILAIWSDVPKNDPAKTLRVFILYLSLILAAFALFVMGLLLLQRAAYRRGIVPGPRSSKLLRD